MKIFRFPLIFVILFSWFLHPDVVQSEPLLHKISISEKDSFSNLLLPKGADPWVMRKDSLYYYTHTNGKNIQLWATPHIEKLSQADSKVVWTSAPDNIYRQIWAPELHHIDGKWYLYFTATFNSGTENSVDENRRMYVLENSSASPMNDKWVFKGKITDSTDHWAIDGTVMEYERSNYFIWSGWRSRDKASNTGRQQLYIAKHLTPPKYPGYSFPGVSLRFTPG